MTVKINADTSDGLKFVSDTSGEIDLQANGSTKVHMASDGKVGIGTTSPSGALQIGGTDSTLISGEGTGDRDFSTDTFGTIDIPSFSLMNQITDSAKNISGLGMNFTNGVLGIVNNYQYTGGGKIAFYTGTKTSTGGSLTEAMRIDASGNMGIGTTSPSQKLDVNGTINATAFATSPVLSAIAGLSFGAVGTFCFARRSNNTAAGTTYAGSQLSRAGLMSSGFNTNAYEYNVGSTLSGTWRSLGTADDTRNSNPCYTIYVRIS